MANEFDFESTKNAIDDVVANAEEAVSSAAAPAEAAQAAAAETFTAAQPNPFESVSGAAAEHSPLYSTDPLTFGEDPATVQAQDMANDALSAQEEAARLREQLKAQQQAAQERIDALRKEAAGGPSAEAPKAEPAAAAGPFTQPQPEAPHFEQTQQQSQQKAEGPYQYQGQQQYQQSQQQYAGGYSYEQQTPPGAAYDTSYEVKQSGEQPGHKEALISLILGIASIACWFFGISSVISIACGAVGIYFGNKAKTMGNDESIRTIGFVLSIIGLVGGAVVLVACVAVAGMVGCLSIFS